MSVEMGIMLAMASNFAGVAIFYWWHDRRQRRVIEQLFWIQYHAKIVIGSAGDADLEDSDIESVEVGRRELMWLDQEIQKFWEEQE